MKRLTTILAISMLALTAYSQTMTITFKNGHTEKYNMSTIEAIDFANDEGGEGPTDDLNTKEYYDVLQINGEYYACYGYRCFITYQSSWDLSNHSGEILLPCGKLSDAQKDEFDFDYMYSIQVEGNKDLKKGSKLEDYSLVLESIDDNGLNSMNYVSGSAIIIDKQDDDYITIKFDSFKFGYGRDSYTLNGTVQLLFDED